jgi:hypothetical protein
MEQEADNQTTAEIIAATEATPSPNGFGATFDHGPSEGTNPALLMAAAFAGGFLLARLVRRRGS